MNKRELLHERAKKARLPTGPGYVTFQDFVNVVSKNFVYIIYIYIEEKEVE